MAGHQTEHLYQTRPTPPLLYLWGHFLDASVSRLLLAIKLSRDRICPGDVGE